MRMASNKARVASRPFHKWPASSASLPRLPPKPWVPFAKPDENLDENFLAEELNDLSISSMEPESPTTSAHIGTSAPLPMDLTDSPGVPDSVQLDSEPEIMFRGDGTINAPFTEVANSEKPSKSDVKACTKHLKKVARLYGFKVIEVTWVVSPCSSPEPEQRGPQRGPNVVLHPRNPPSKSFRTEGSAFWGGRTYTDIYRQDDIDMTDPILAANKKAIAASVECITKNLGSRGSRK